MKNEELKAGETAQQVRAPKPEAHYRDPVVDRENMTPESYPLTSMYMSVAYTYAIYT